MTKVTIVLDVLVDNLELSIENRHQERIAYTSDYCGQTATINFDVNMPNKLFLHLKKADPSKPIDVNLKIFELGFLRINQDRLIEICQFFPLSGAESYFSRSWNEEGTILIELFDLDPIKFHLHFETTV